MAEKIPFLTREQAAEYFAYLDRRGAEGTLSDNTIHRYKATLRSIGTRIEKNPSLWPGYTNPFSGLVTNENRKRTEYREDMFADPEVIRKIFADEPRVAVAIYDCLTVDFAKEHDAKFILRGMRCIGDFEYERNMAEANKQLAGIETIILYTRPEYAHISSTLVRDLYAYGKDVSDFVPNTLR